MTGQTTCVVSLDQSSASSSGGLTREQIATYHEEGYLFPVPALKADEVLAVRNFIEGVEATGGGKWPSQYAHKPHLLFRTLDEVIRHVAILDVVESLLGRDILCWSSRLFIKDSHDGGIVSWHQDLPYWGLDVSENIVTAWLALTPATRANGVMKVVPRSHRRLVEHREAAATNLLRRGQEIAVVVDEADAVAMTLQAGEFSLHHGLLFHGSDENRSGDRRVGFAIRYIPTRVRPLDGLPRDTATLVRGEDRYHHFDLLSPPEYDLAAQALLAQRRASAASDRIRDLAAQRHREMVGDQSHGMRS